MNKKLLHSLAILALAFFAGKCELLTAQSGGIERSDPGPVAEGMAKNKTYKFSSIDYPGANTSNIYDFNGKTAVGEFFSPDSAFTFRGSSYAPLSVPGAIYSGGYGINTPGEIVGWYEDSSDDVHGFLYDGSRYTTIDYPGGGSTRAWDINDAGLIVGYYIDSNAVYHGFLYDKGTFTAINFPGADYTFAYGINSSGDIVGTYSLAGIQNGFLLKNGNYSTVDFPGADNTEALGINDAGSIAGAYYGNSGADYGFTYTGGAFHEVVVPEALDTLLVRIKNNGNVVVIVVDGLLEEHGIIGR
jgi:probable HAF family extracellular repeat protein